MKPGQFVLRATLILMATLLSGVIILASIIEPHNLKLTVYICVPPICVCLFFAIFLKWFIRERDTFTAEGFVRQKHGKVKYEINWDNVERIAYNKLSLSTILMLFPMTCWIYCKEPITAQKKEEPTAILTSCTFKEIQQIQQIIPIQIEF